MTQFIFDATQPDGYAFSTSWRWLAWVSVRVLTRTTGRAHDFDSI